MESISIHLDILVEFSRSDLFAFRVFSTMFERDRFVFLWVTEIASQMSGFVMDYLIEFRFFCKCGMLLERRDSSNFIGLGCYNVFLELWKVL